VSLDSEQLEALRSFLRTNLLFYTSVSTLRDRPFEFPDAPSERGTLQEAAATKPRRGLLIALFLGGLLLSIAGSAWEYFLWRQNLAEKSKQPPPVFTLDYLWQYAMHLLSLSPENLPQKLFHSMPVLCMAIGLFLLTAAGVFLSLDVPAHQADPLLARLMQETLRSKSAPSNSYIQSLLANLRFKKIFERTVFTVFPLKITNSEDEYPIKEPGRWWRRVSSSEDEYPIMRDGEYQPAPSSISPDWGDFIRRLLDTLSRHEPFVHFMENHPGTPPEMLFGYGLQEYLDYGMRQLLFTEMLGDPDCAFLYGNSSTLWHGIFHWMSTADLKKVLDLFPKVEKSSGGADKKSLAIYVLILLLLMSLLQKLPWQKSPEGKDRNPLAPPAPIEVMLDAHQLVEKLTELTAKLCQPCAQQQQQTPTPPQPISISVPASPAPTIDIPPINVPSKIEVAISSTVPVATTESQQNVNIPPTTSKSEDTTIETPPPPKQTMQGDTLVSFTRPQPSQQSKEKQTVEDRDFSSSFVLHTHSRDDCPYTVTLPGTSDKWPPDPVQMKVHSSGYLPKDCPQIPSAGAIISVSRKPLYNDLLQAYVSLDETHSHHLYFFGHDQIVVLIHYATPKFE
jgi:hypothetical protein